MPAQIGLKKLVKLCQRTAVSHATGVDARKIWRREAEQGTPTEQRQFARISAAVDRGATLADAFNETGDFLPQLFRDMVQVGEQTGHVDESLNRLARHYEHVQTVRSTFLKAILWPLIQLFVAVMVIGLAIFVMGFIDAGPGGFDPTGFGLTGGRGAAIYFACVGATIFGGFIFVRSLMRGRVSATIMSFLMSLPVVGPWLQLMAMSRMSWTLGMAVNAGMDAQRCVQVALRSTQNQYFTQQGKSIRASISRGDSLYDAFQATGVFATDFLDGVQVGEETGRLAETMEQLSKQYEERAKSAMSSAAVVAGFLVWAAVATVLIVLIFRFASFYLKTAFSFEPI